MKTDKHYILLTVLHLYGFHQLYYHIYIRHVYNKLFN
jgi:hypothetical protein